LRNRPVHNRPFTTDLKAAKSFLETTECTLRTQQHGNAEKSGLRDVKRADFIRYWRRSGL